MPVFIFPPSHSNETNGQTGVHKRLVRALAEKLDAEGPQDFSPSALDTVTVTVQTDGPDGPDTSVLTWKRPAKVFG
jgi:hypothetical protein